MYVPWNSSTVLTLRKFQGKFLRLSREVSSIFKGSFFDFQGSYQRFSEVRFDFTQVWFTWLCVKSLEILLEKVDMFNVSFGNRGRPGPVSRIRRWCTVTRWSSSPAGTVTTRSRSSTSMTPPRSSGIRCHQEERRQQRGLVQLFNFFKSHQITKCEPYSEFWMYEDGCRRVVNDTLYYSYYSDHCRTVVVVFAGAHTIQNVPLV